MNCSMSSGGRRQARWREPVVQHHPGSDFPWCRFGLETFSSRGRLCRCQLPFRFLAFPRIFPPESDLLHSGYVDKLLVHRKYPLVNTVDSFVYPYTRVVVFSHAAARYLFKQKTHSGKVTHTPPRCKLLRCSPLKSLCTTGQFPTVFVVRLFIPSSMGA